MIKKLIIRIMAILGYIAAVIIIFKNRNVIPAPLGMITRDLVLIALSICFLIIITELLRYPFGKRKFDKAFRKIGLKNALSEYPVLLSAKRDKHKEHGVIYTIKNMGIPITDFDNSTPALQAALDLMIYRLDYGRNAKKTKIHAIPFKYDKPRIISTDSTDLADDMINILCIGATGSGKSYALLTILGLFAKTNAKIYICDYKNGFSKFENTQNFYGYEDIADGIQAVYKEFSERLKENNQERNNNKVVLLIDEYGAFISAIDKKNAEQYKTMVANMLFMGRSLGIIVLIGIQRADSEYFKAGARDQFKMVLALGNLSKEQKSMLFYDYRDKLNHNNGVGEGYLLIDGKGVERVKVATIKNFDTLNANITEAMNR